MLLVTDKVFYDLQMQHSFSYVVLIFFCENWVIFLVDMQEQGRCIFFAKHSVHGS